MRGTLGETGVIGMVDVQHISWVNGGGGFPSVIAVMAPSYLEGPPIPWFLPSYGSSNKMAPRSHGPSNRMAPPIPLSPPSYGSSNKVAPLSHGPSHLTAWSIFVLSLPFWLYGVSLKVVAGSLNKNLVLFPLAWNHS